MAGTVVSFVLAWALYLVSLLVHGVSNVSGVLSENAGMIPVFLAVFFITISIMIPVQIKCGAESARVMMARNLFSVCRCDSVCAESRRRSDTGSNHGADWHHYGHNSGPGRNFYCRHRGFADFVPDQCRIYGENRNFRKNERRQISF